MAQRAYISLEPETERPAPPELHLVENEPPAPRSVIRRNPREIASLALLSVVLHAGMAFGFYRNDTHQPVRRVSKVDIDFARAPDPPKAKLAPPPPPPKLEKQAPPALAPKALLPQPSEPSPSLTEVSEPVASDTGSSAEAAEEGNLQAGKGGLGVHPTALAPVSPVAPPRPAPVLAAHEGANYSKNPRPGYPARAVREGWQGEVLVRVQVLPNGRAGLLKVQRSAGFPVLDEAALAAIKGWSFVPAKQGGQAVSGWVTVPIVFRLQ